MERLSESSDVLGVEYLAIAAALIVLGVADLVDEGAPADPQQQGRAVHVDGLDLLCPGGERLAHSVRSLMKSANSPSRRNHSRCARWASKRS